MSILLSCENIEKSIGNRLLFKDIALQIQNKERVGLIGPNGSGKSTLLKILARIIEADGGDVTIAKGVKMVYLPQVEQFDGEKTILQAAVEVSENDTEELYEREANAAIMLSKIGFEDLNLKVKNLSGGWLKRLSIARQLARGGDIVLLDEPTNHLDIEGVEWLENYLKSAPFSYIIITHDREFLESATNRIIELNDVFDEGLISFNCAYDEFVYRRERFIEGERSRCESMANKNRREQEWVRSGVRARGTKQKARLKEAEGLQEEVGKLRKQTAEPTKVLIDFEKTERKTKRLIAAHHICKSYGDKQILNDLDLVVTPGMRIGLLGLNGAGKSTLMKLLASEEKVDSGSIAMTTGCKVLHFDQNRQLMDEKETLREALSLNGSDMVVYRDKQIHISAWARKLKFRGDQLESPISSLSGGERARVVMGRLMLQTADVLLLDEPTNDLDIPSIEVLEESLQTFPGALVLVTHDRALLDRVSTTLLALDGKGGVENYSSYKQWKDRNKKKSKAQAEEVSAKEVLGKPDAPAAKKITKLSYNEQREWDMMEETILEAEGALELLQNNPVDAADAIAFAQYCEELGEAQQTVDTLYARWSEIEAKLAIIQEGK